MYHYKWLVVVLSVLLLLNGMELIDNVDELIKKLFNSNIEQIVNNSESFDTNIYPVSSKLYQLWTHVNMGIHDFDSVVQTNRYITSVTSVINSLGTAIT